MLVHQAPMLVFQSTDMIFQVTQFQPLSPYLLGLRRMLFLKLFALPFQLFVQFAQLALLLPLGRQLLASLLLRRHSLLTRVSLRFGDRFRHGGTALHACLLQHQYQQHDE
jgi:hypothetical protein